LPIFIKKHEKNFALGLDIRGFYAIIISSWVFVKV